jgi:hypothetical protein
MTATKLALIAILMCLCLPLGGCASPVWRVYDACAAQTSGFVAMVECGKAKRQASCSKDFWDGCSSVGNAFVQYADALAMQVQNHEISEADAMAKFAEYKTRTINDVARNEAIEDSAAAAAAAGAYRRPMTCNTIGGVTNCF